MTAPAAARLKLTIRGSLPGGEVWATSLQFAPDETPTRDDLVALQAGTQFQGLKTAMLSLMSTQTRIVGLTAYLYPAGAPAPAAAVYEIPVTGSLVGTGQSDHPSQIAAVVSLQGNPAGGTVIRNRAYFVGNGLATVGGLYDTSPLQEIASRVRRLADAEAGVAYSPERGLRAFVDLVYTDIIPDTQRRRRDALRAPRIIGQPA